MERELLLGATIGQLSWISGAWKGTVGDDPVEEVWTGADGGTMMGMFRWLRNGAPRFYEMIVLEPDSGGIVMRVRHFSSGKGFRSWEGQESAMEFRLTEVAEGHAVFCQADDPDTWLVYDLVEGGLRVAFASATGKPPVEKPFLFRRASF